MGPLQSLKFVWARWILILTIVLAGLATGGVFSYLSPVEYAASSTLYVSAQADASGTASAYQGSLLSEQRVKSYQVLATSSRVANNVATSGQSKLTPSEIQKRVSVSAESDTVLLTITVTGGSAEEATALGNAITDSFVQLVSALEQPANQALAPPVVVRVVQPAEATSSPVAPNTALNLAVGAFLGLFFGLGFAYLCEVSDTSIKSAAQVKDIAAVSVLGTIAADSRGLTPGSTLDSLSVSTREGFKQLRTSLQYVDVDTQMKTFLISSGSPGEGKTSTSIFLSSALSQAGYRVLLVDADLRRPRVAENVQVDGAVGLTTVLARRIDARAAIQKVSRFGLSVLASGETPPNPSELLGSSRMKDCLDRFRLEYDIVLIDAPPVLAFTDAAALAAKVDGVVLVLAYGTTTRTSLAQSIENFSSVGARLAGVVLNKAPVSKQSYGDYSRYGYTEDAESDTGVLRLGNRNEASKPSHRETANSTGGRRQARS